MTSFANIKKIRYEITLGTNKFANGSGAVKLEGFRSSVNVKAAGGAFNPEMNCRIYGVSLPDMAAATTLQYQPGIYKPENKISVFAIDGKQETLIFTGFIIQAWPEFESMPEVCLFIQAANAITAGFDGSPQAFSYPNAVSASQVFNDIGSAFGRNPIIVDPDIAGIQLAAGFRSEGDYKWQLREIAKALDVQVYLGPNDASMEVVKQNNARITAEMLTISAENGLVKYPAIGNLDVRFSMQFTPGLVWGNAFELKTDAPRAAGKWFAQSIEIELTQDIPGGAWFTHVVGQKFQVKG